MCGRKDVTTVGWRKSVHAMDRLHSWEFNQITSWIEITVLITVRLYPVSKSQISPDMFKITAVRLKHCFLWLLRTLYQFLASSLLRRFPATPFLFHLTLLLFQKWPLFSLSANAGPYFFPLLSLSAGCKAAQHGSKLLSSIRVPKIWDFLHFL